MWASTYARARYSYSYARAFGGESKHVRSRPVTPTSRVSVRIGDAGAQGASEIARAAQKASRLAACRPRWCGSCAPRACRCCGN